MDTNCDVSFVETKRMSSENVYILAFLRKKNYVEVYNSEPCARHDLFTDPLFDVKAQFFCSCWVTVTNVTPLKHALWDSKKD